MKSMDNLKTEISTNHIFSHANGFEKPDLINFSKVQNFGKVDKTIKKTKKLRLWKS
jgi:hypothetical protein